jgi:hypothetical protein
MPPLPTDLRNQLSRAVEKARAVAERGAREALQGLAVDAAKPHAGMSDDEKALRNRLRAHARQLGDARNAKTGAHEIALLAHEVAYEHWHRMLFARFLAENELLVEPGSKVTVSLQFCRELARERKMDPWAMAAGFAQGMLPEIFRADDPALEVTLAPETRGALEELLSKLPPEIFTADDSLGWTYQFWQSAAKDAVNERVKSGEKITGRTLPAVTQLFTEHYMVLFLLHNTLGAWHAGKTLTAEDAESAETEGELRRKVSLPEIDWEYLRFVREPQDTPDDSSAISASSAVNPSGPWRPAAGSFASWPREAKSLTVLDPCCGSGHFLVAAFEILVRLRMAEEGLDLEAGAKAVIADNLFGLELDPRCTQIAAFNLAFAAWKLVGKPIPLPPMRIACSGLGPQCSREEWLKIADEAGEAAWAGISPGDREFIRNGLIDLHATFSQAPELGSLIDPANRSTDLITADYETLKPFLATVFEAERGDAEARERAVAARGMAEAAEILVGPDEGYTLVVTNVPYITRQKQGSVLRDFSARRYARAKADLATTMLSRMMEMLGDGATAAAVTPNSWLFLPAYKHLRKRSLERYTWSFVARLGPGAFETISGHVVNVALLGISRSAARDSTPIATLDCNPLPSVREKLGALRNERPRLISHAEQRGNPDARIILDPLPSHPRLSKAAASRTGTRTGDNLRLLRQFVELPIPSPCCEWVLMQSTVKESQSFGGREQVLHWGDGSNALVELDDLGIASIQGEAAWNRDGIAVSLMSDLPVTRYVGQAYDMNCGVIWPLDPDDLAALWEFCSSSSFTTLVRKIDQQLKLTTATLIKVPFDSKQWRQNAAEKYPEGLPEPQTNDPTQWLFHGHPAGMLCAGPSDNSPVGLADPVGAERHPSLICREPNMADVLQVGVARLLGYRWPAELDADMRLDSAQRAWVERCAALASHADADGIVCLSPLKGESSAADRLRRLLAAAFGEAWSPALERELLAAAAEKHKQKKPGATLDEWLRERFFEEHCKVFGHRPFIWHIWDGRDDGFHALVNCHRLCGPEGEGRRTLEAVTWAYLGDWIDRQRAAQREEQGGADARLAAAQALQKELEAILAGEPPYDLFVRWKALDEQAIGWEPDLNDGVRLNIRPLLLAKDMGRKGAGILRWKPNIKWDKDRGKEPESLRPRERFPWFWGWKGWEKERAPDFEGRKEFTGQRWNDLHYTVAAKRTARGADRL